MSFVDAVLLMAASPRPIRFVMDHRIFKIPVLGWMFKLAKAIPVASQKEDPAAYAAAFEAADKVLADGDLLCIFPEGAITRDGAVAAVQGRHHEDPRAPAGAGGAGGAAEPVGLVFLARRRFGDGQAVSPRAVQPASGWWPAARCRRPR